eukprot:TRINITY_DN210_c0_g1_i2.p1 TRINITY_DN210_c0_g1~~TRINITY_DN210_c0_g1_i2.p1  ORF type:complete len:323 (-),score=95.87 TRINITY_DN210_c0_g1_i2:357-1325(-)
MSSLDICFVIDCSSSMHRSIERMQPQMHDIVDRIVFEVEKKRKKCQVRFAVVLFRDHDYKTKRLEFTDFSQHDQDVHDVINAIEPIGGHDTPEDVLGGLNCAANLDWQNEVRHLIFIGDAPCHGTKYHSITDSYPDGDPLGLTPEGVLGEMRQKRIRFNFVKLSKDTNIMVEIFREIYESDPNSTKKGKGEANSEEDKGPKPSALKLEVFDCQKELIYSARDMLIQHIIKSIRVPITLLYSAAMVVKKSPNWTDFVDYIPLEMEEFINDVLEVDAPKPDIGSIHLEIQSGSPAGSPEKSKGSIPSTPIVLYSTKPLEVGLCL